MQISLEHLLNQAIAKCPAADKETMHRFCQAIYDDPRFARINPQTLIDEIENMVGLAPIHDIPKAVDNLHYFVANISSAKTASMANLYKAPSAISKAVSNFKALETTNQVMVGMALIGAVLGANNTISHGSQIVERDQNGKAHLRPSMVMLTLFEGALTIGSGLIGMAMLKGAAR